MLRLPTSPDGDDSLATGRGTRSGLASPRPAPLRLHLLACLALRCWVPAPAWARDHQPDQGRHRFAHNWRVHQGAPCSPWAGGQRLHAPVESDSAAHLATTRDASTTASTCVLDPGSRTPCRSRCASTMAADHLRIPTAAGLSRGLPAGCLVGPRVQSPSCPDVHRSRVSWERGHGGLSRSPLGPVGAGRTIWGFRVGLRTGGSASRWAACMGHAPGGAVRRRRRACVIAPVWRCSRPPDPPA